MSNTAAAAGPTSVAPDGDVQIVVFAVAGELYAADIAVVHEIGPLQRITPVPGLPPYLRGVTNLRGRVIPVVDLRLRLGLAAGPPTAATRIAVVETAAGTVGMIVDGVVEVQRLAAGALEPPPTAVGEADDASVLGVARSQGRLVTLLDLERVLARDRTASA